MHFLWRKMSIFPLNWQHCIALRICNRAINVCLKFSILNSTPSSRLERTFVSVCHKFRYYLRQEFEFWIFSNLHRDRRGVICIKVLDNNLLSCNFSLISTLSVDINLNIRQTSWSRAQFWIKQCCQLNLTKMRFGKVLLRTQRFIIVCCNDKREGRRR